MIQKNENYESNIDLNDREVGKIVSNVFGTYKSILKSVRGEYVFNCKKLGKITLRVKGAEQSFIETENKKGYYDDWRTKIYISCPKLKYFKDIKPVGIIEGKENVIKEVKKVFNPKDIINELKLAEIDRILREDREQYEQAMNSYYEEGIM